MKWKIKSYPNIGDTRIRTKFAFLPIIVLNKATMTDHWVWLEFYAEEQVYKTKYHYGEGNYEVWITISKSINK